LRISAGGKGFAGLVPLAGREVEDSSVDALAPQAAEKLLAVAKANRTIGDDGDPARPGQDIRAQIPRDLLEEILADFDVVGLVDGPAQRDADAASITASEVCGSALRFSRARGWRDFPRHYPVASLAGWLARRSFAR